MTDNVIAPHHRMGLAIADALGVPRSTKVRHVTVELDVDKAPVIVLTVFPNKAAGELLGITYREDVPA